MFAAKQTIRFFDKVLFFLQITGSTEAVESAKIAVDERMKEIDADREDREKRSYELEVSIQARNT